MPYDHERDEVKKGVRIGGWELVRQLNVGGMGQVWQVKKVFETGGQLVAAMKMLRPAGVLDERSRASLLTEGRVSMTLDHDCIPKTFDVGIHEELPYVVMEYISGRDLSQLLRVLREQGTPLDPILAAHIARNVAAALDYAHNRLVQGVPDPVIHRDVSPKNVMISGQGGVFLLDFGIAEVQNDKTSGTFIKGTLLYMAPEQLRGFAGPASDAFGLGAMLWEMLEHRVFRADVPQAELRGRVSNGWVPTLTRKDVPEELRFLVEGLLRPDPNQRLTVREFINALEDAGYPDVRGRLATLMVRIFGNAVLSSGHTLHDFKLSDELDQALAAAEMVKKAARGKPPIKTTWGAEAFEQAGAPHVVAVSGTRPVGPDALSDDESQRVELAEVISDAEPDEGPTLRVLAGPPRGKTELAPETQPGAAVPEPEAQAQALGPGQAPTIVQPRRPPGGRVAAVDGTIVPQTIQLEHGLAVRPASPVANVTEPMAADRVDVPVRRTHERTTPPVAKAATQPAPVGMQADDALPRARPSASLRVRIQRAAVAGLVVVLVLGAGMMLDLLVEPTAPPAQAPEPTADESPSGPRSSGAERPFEPPAATTRATKQPSPSDEIPTTADPSAPERPTPDDLTKPASIPGNIEGVAPGTVEPTDQPVAAPPPTRKRTEPKPTVPRSTIDITVGFIDDTEISIDGQKRTLSQNGPERATMKVRPGRRTVRWGPAGKKLTNSKQVVIVEGVDYRVHLGSAGPSFEAIGGKP